MQDSVLNFLGSALIPVLGTDVAAGTAGNVHLALVGIAALRTYPNQLAIIFLNLNFTVIAALLAEVGFGIQLCVHNVLINELHQLQHGINVLLHIGHFHIGNSATGGQLLEVRLKAKLREGVNFFCYVHVIGIGDVTAVGDAGNDTKPLLQALGNL